MMWDEVRPGDLLISSFGLTVLIYDVHPVRWHPKLIQERLYVDVIDRRVSFDWAHPDGEIDTTAWSVQPYRPEEGQ